MSRTKDISLTEGCLTTLRLAPKDPQSDQDVYNLIELVANLDETLQREVGREFPIADIPDVVSALSVLWEMLLEYYDLRRQSAVPRSVTDGNILRYKIVRVLADLNTTIPAETLSQLSVGDGSAIITSLEKYIAGDFDKTEPRDRSFSHMAVKALVFLDRHGIAASTYTMISAGIAAGEIDRSYRRYIASQLA